STPCPRANRRAIRGRSSRPRWRRTPDVREGMKLSDFDFDLPEDRIALRPAEPRDSARLLVLPPESEAPGGGMLDRTVRDLPSFLKPGDLLVFNDTRVIPARLNGV